MGWLRWRRSRRSRSWPTAATRKAARNRQVKTVRIASFGELVDLGSLGIGQAEALADLVEYLAHGVVAGFGEARDVAAVDV